MGSLTDVAESASARLDRYLRIVAIGAMIYYALCFWEPKSPIGTEPNPALWKSIGTTTRCLQSAYVPRARTQIPRCARDDTCEKQNSPPIRLLISWWVSEKPSLRFTPRVR
jgi:hypothetical protein